MAALGITSLVSVVAAVIDLWYADLIDRILGGVAAVPQSEIDAGDLVHGVSGIVETVTYLAAAVAFLVWLYRTRVNAEALAPHAHRHSRVWAVLGWVVPIVALWFPKQVVDDVWDASARTPSPPKALFHAWWAAWLVSNWGAGLISRALFRAEEAEEYAAAARFDVVSIGLSLIAAALAVPVVLRITQAQERRREELAAGLHPAYTGYPWR
ncbi:DUF4328 domain-containing protein [Actinomadura sp. ATCC 31491]|uniref:DUF4328 domain-containing protein n=1 Tax=Actinomadura luzonensis TaxID=2805427 RepID=A0ABT0FKK5_9ACTN|nr:DUF4328 domain-containing protein [Actinomadura luzonensis]MCK2212845.1 DUF4328 domain-containing protein [Actinomadura luzonensis]